jgi:hypothetical protein
MTARARTLLSSALGLAVLTGGVFWAAKRAPEAVPEHAASVTSPASPGENVAEVAAPRVAAPTLPAPAAPVPVTSAPTPEDENALMSELRNFKDTDPEFAIERAREGNRRFPDSAAAPERSSILIHALASLGRASEARGEAEDMVNRYPDSEWVREVERFTGAHRHRNVHLNAEGQLAFD